MKRAYEALGIACPTSVSNMTGGFPRAPLARMSVPRPPGLTDVVPQPAPMQQLFQQNQQDLQQQQLVSALPPCPIRACDKYVRATGTFGRRGAETCDQTAVFSRICCISSC